METIIYVDNLKCGGCANTISKAVLTFKDIDDVKINTEESKIIISHIKDFDLIAVKSKLHDIGYPEHDTTEGVDKFATNLKSYVSCAIGKFNTETDKSQNLK